MEKLIRISILPKYTRKDESSQEDNDDISFSNPLVILDSSFFLITKKNKNALNNK